MPELLLALGGVLLATLGFAAGWLLREGILLGRLESRKERALRARYVPAFAVMQTSRTTQNLAEVSTNLNRARAVARQRRAEANCNVELLRYEAAARLEI